MIELLLALELSCADIRGIVYRMKNIDLMTPQEKMEVLHTLEESVPNCKIDIELQ